MQEYKYELYGFYWDELKKKPNVSHVDIETEIGTQRITLASVDIVNEDDDCKVFDFGTFELDQEINYKTTFASVKDCDGKQLGQVEIVDEIPWE